MFTKKEINLKKIDIKRVNLKQIDLFMKILGEEYKKFKTPIVTEISEFGKLDANDTDINTNNFNKNTNNADKIPFKVLISTLLSLRTKDETTAKPSYNLFNIADTQQKILSLPTKKLEKIIYPVGFYKTKARRIKDICDILIKKYNNKVPDDIDELLKLKGVGRKTANLVVSLGYGKPGLCIDTHCHRIPNRWGWITTKTPFETEMTLRNILPQKYWKEFNDYLVAFGQNVCRPVGPRCYECRLEKWCRYSKKTVK